MLGPPAEHPVLKELSGPIHDALKGFTVAAVMTDDKRLVIQTTSGRVVRVIWTEDGPVLEGYDQRVMIRMGSNA